MKQALAVLLAGAWITLSEFIRNEFLLKSYWTDHYNTLSLTFETLPLNGVLWFIWSLIFAFIVMKLLQNNSLKETLIISWLAAFVMMWITIYNLQVLPLPLLLFAVPWSILEVLIAIIIVQTICEKLKRN